MAVTGTLAAPGLALAQMSGTEVYGTVYPTFGRVAYGSGNTAANNSGTAVPSMSKLDVQAPASNFGVRSRENLGGGLTAWVQIEQNAPLERETTAAVTIASRNSAAGIQGGFGNVFVGQWTTPWADLESLWNVGTVGIWGPSLSIIGRRETTGAPPQSAPGGSGCTQLNSGGATLPGVPPTLCDAVAGAGGVGHPFWRRASNMVRYTSLGFGGATFDFLYQVPEGKRVVNATGAPVATYTASMWSTSLQWAGMGGRARVGLAIDRHKDFTSVGNADGGYALKGGWNFGVVDVGVAIERMTYKCGSAALSNAGGSATSAPFSGCNAAVGGGDVKAKQYGVAASVPVGPGAIKVAYSKAAALTGAASLNPNDTGAKEWNVGYAHNFSKRTVLGVGYAKITNERNANFTWTGMAPVQNGFSNTPLVGTSVSWMFVNMIHRF
jgi:predicted porin